MYELNDTIAAISSPASCQRVIIRITGPDTLGKSQQTFRPKIGAERAGITTGKIIIDDELDIDAKLYLFPADHSYTGEDLAEFHFFANSAVTETLMEKLLGMGLRTAGPGEFTARAYLNGKLDLAQAEAVNEIITSSNRFQLAAAEKLLAGQLAQKTAEILASITDCLSFIEAGLDFSGEDIEFITRQQAAERLGKIKDELEKLLAGSIRYESVVDAPAIGIAGAPNAGKSSLLNRLTGRQRSIVSKQRKTTRDVLTDILTLPNSNCVLFDCAGLILRPDNIIDELAQFAAVKAMQNSLLAVFCVDLSKTDWREDLEIRNLISTANILAVATKCDLLKGDLSAEKLTRLKKLFSVEFLLTSAETGAGIDQLKRLIDKKIVDILFSGTRQGPQEQQGHIALTARHRQAVTEAIESIDQSVDHLKGGNDEICAMLLRTAYQAVSNIQQKNLDEHILDNIFSRFCIGK
ncbi:MAG: tRNA modification GTPase [Planctomycetota bacterium]|jgi:tRNA modification GTPase